MPPPPRVPLILQHLHIHTEPRLVQCNMAVVNQVTHFLLSSELSVLQHWLYKIVLYLPGLAGQVSARLAFLRAAEHRNVVLRVRHGLPIAVMPSGIIRPHAQPH